MVCQNMLPKVSFGFIKTMMHGYGKIGKVPVMRDTQGDFDFNLVLFIFESRLYFLF